MVRMVYEFGQIKYINLTRLSRFNFDLSVINFCVVKLMTKVFDNVTLPEIDRTFMHRLDDLLPEG